MRHISNVCLAHGEIKCRMLHKHSASNLMFKLNLEKLIGDQSIEHFLSIDKAAHKLPVHLLKSNVHVMNRFSCTIIA